MHRDQINHQYGTIKIKKTSSDNKQDTCSVRLSEQQHALVIRLLCNICSEVNFTCII
jgi:hypothetical protein